MYLRIRILRWMAVAILALAALAPGRAAALAPQAGTTYYVSSSAGSDSNDGLAESRPLATIARVNSLTLQPGDRVLLRCGDVWRADPLAITHSGSSGQPITFSSYPAGCANQPALSGARPVAGWSPYGGNVYAADLAAGANAGKFGYGINQVFRNGTRLTMGRWPNLNAADGGYASIDSQPAGAQFSDSALPAGDWTGAVAHIRGMRWYILNRQVTGDSGSTLTVGAALDCWNGCAGWGYFLNNHLATLDQDGEWYYDDNARRLYLYSAAGAPADNQVEASVILHDDDRSWGAVQLGEDLADPIAYVTVDNLAIRAWYRHGIATPTNLHPTENHDVTLTNNTIQDVDGIGVNLATWVWGATDGRPDGWRGGYNHSVRANTIERANQMGINTYTRNSTFSVNQVRDVGRIANLGAAGMGCDFDAGEGACTEDGDGIRVKVDQPADTANFNTFSENRLERIGYNGFDVFGHDNTFTHNVVSQACISKGDCGGLRSFGRSSLAQTAVYNLTLTGNLILDTLGNTDGCRSDFDPLFGFGLYIDNYSKNVSLNGNAVINSSATGVLFQNSTGSLSGNTLYNNGYAYDWAGQVWVTGSPSAVSSHSGNILYSLNPNGWTLALDSPGVFGASDRNYFFNPYRAAHIRAAGNKTLAAWRTYSGKDAASKEAWFSLASGAATNSSVFINDSAQDKVFDLDDHLYLDLDQAQVSGSLTLAPYTVKILIDQGPAPLALTRISPFMLDVDAAAGFTLAAYGMGFTENSVVRWNGAARPTTFVSQGELHAAISAADVASVGAYPVTVYDATYPPGSAETMARLFFVSQEVYWLQLPLLAR